MTPAPLPVNPDTLRTAEGRRDPASDVLVRALSDRDFAARAAVAMGRIQSRGYLEPLMAVAPTRETIWALGQWGLAIDWRPADAEKLLPFLSKAADDAGLRAAAIAALGKCGGVVPEGAFQDPSAAVRLAAVDATWRAAILHKAKRDPGPVAALAADADEEVRWHVAYALWRLGARHESLRTLAKDENRWARLYAARALADGTGIGDPEALVRVEALRGAKEIPAAIVNDPSAMVRRMAARVKPDAFLDDVSAMVRAEAVAHSGKPQLAHLDWRIRAASASAIRDYAALRPALEDPERRVVLAAIQSMGEMKDDGSRTRLEQFVSCGDVALEWTAIEALQKRKQGIETLAARAKGTVNLALEPLIEALESFDATEPLRELAGLPGIVYPALARRAYFRASGAELPFEPRGYPRSRFLMPAGRGKVTVDFLHERGAIRMLLDLDVAPENAANVVALVKRGYYAGLDWHRVEPNFVIQGGDPRFDGWGDPGYRVLDEVSMLPHTRGAVGISRMAKDTGDSQLYITHVPTPHLDGRYTVIGYVIDGLDVLDRIEPGDRILGARVVEER